MVVSFDDGEVGKGGRGVVASVPLARGASGGKGDDETAFFVKWEIYILRCEGKIVHFPPKLWVSYEYFIPTTRNKTKKYPEKRNLQQANAAYFVKVS